MIGLLVAVLAVSFPIARNWVAFIVLTWKDFKHNKYLDCRHIMR